MTTEGLSPSGASNAERARASHGDQAEPDAHKLNSITALDFARILYERATRIADDLYREDAYVVEELADSERKLRNAYYMRRRSWTEWYFGTVTVSRQICLLPDDWPGLKLQLARQLCDEVRHHDVFARLAYDLGNRLSLKDFSLPKGISQMKQAHLTAQDSAELAVANQFSGEIALSSQDRAGNNILRQLMDPRVIAALEDVATDEPRHISLGRQLVTTLARDPESDPDLRSHMYRVQTSFFESFVSQQLTDIELLGAVRRQDQPITI